MPSCLAVLRLIIGNVFGDVAAFQLGYVATFMAIHFDSRSLRQCSPSRLPRRAARHTDFGLTPKRWGQVA